MPEYNIYPNQITKIYIGRAELKGYDCPKPCFVNHGFIAQEERITMYFDCPHEEKGDDCKYLSDFLRGEHHSSLIKTKRGTKHHILNDLTEAILYSKFDEVTLPFEINIIDDYFTPKNLEAYFKGIVGCETKVHNVKGEGQKFTLELTKIKEIKPKSSFKKFIHKLKSK